MSFIEKLIRFLTTKKYIVKKRYVFYVDTKQFSDDITEAEQADLQIRFFDFDTESREELSDILKVVVPEFRLKRYLSRYDQPDIWKAIFTFCNGKPVACMWVMIVPYDNFRFDSFLHQSGEIMWGSSYVKPSHRGRRIHNKMKCFFLKNSKDEFDNNKILSVVEKRNKKSIKSNKRLGVKMYGENYLVKFMGKNIFSIFKDMNGKWKVWFLPLYKQTHY